MLVIGDEVGALVVILWLVAMIVVGMNLLRYLGASSMIVAAQNIRTGELPGVAIAEGLFKALGAILLIIPGFITDALALLCFIPWLRGLLIKRWAAKIAIRAAGFTQRQNPFGRDAGNIYEHDGQAQKDNQRPDKSVLIEQDMSQTDQKSSPDDHKKP